MVRPRPRRIALIGFAAIAFLVAAAVAYAAASRSFRGKTSQRQPIALAVSRGFVRKLDYRIVDKCPGGTTLTNHDSHFSPIQISHSKFGGTFTDRAHHARATVNGTIMHGIVRGSLADRTRNAMTHKVCSGHAKFRLGRR